MNEWVNWWGVSSSFKKCQSRDLTTHRFLVEHFTGSQHSEAPGRSVGKYGTKQHSRPPHSSRKKRGTGKQIKSNLTSVGGIQQLLLEASKSSHEWECFEEQTSSPNIGHIANTEIKRTYPENRDKEMVYPNFIQTHRMTCDVACLEACALRYTAAFPAWSREKTANCQAPIFVEQPRCLMATTSDAKK